MKKNATIVLIILAVVLVVVGFFASGYNGIVSKSEEVDSKLSDVSVQLQRRVDLIPNLVSTVKGYAKHEKDTIEAVASAKAKLAGAQSLTEKAEANDELSSALSRLLVVVEKYPDLKANTNFIQLQDELAGTENRLAVSRRDYNAAVKDYNKTIKLFPKNILANLFGFEAKDYFEAKEDAQDAPQISFD